MQRRRWFIRMAATAVGVAIAAGAVYALVDGGSSDGRGRDRLERRAARLVAQRVRHHQRGLKVSTRCRRGGRSGGSVRLSCRWRSEHFYTPNRRRVCRGRFRVTLAHRARPQLMRRKRSRCGRVTRALHPELGFNNNAVVQRHASAREAATLLENLGAGIDRLTFDWRYAEFRKDAYQLRQYDDVYRADTQRGIRPLWVVLFAPSWLWDPGVRCGGDCRYPPRRDRLDDWRQIVALLARRYPRSAGIEIWNEPNERAFWRPQPDPARYAGLLREAYSAIKAANPHMRVVAGGLTTRNQTANGDISLADFIHALFGNGAGGSLDVASLHPYPAYSDITFIDHAVTTLAGLLGEAGSHVPVWATETGLTTGGSPTEPLHVTEAGQAAGLVSAYRELRSRSEVRAIMFHTLIDPPGGAVNTEAGFGIVRGDHSLKPAYCALSRELRTGKRCP